MSCKRNGNRLLIGIIRRVMKLDRARFMFLIEQLLNEIMNSS